MNATQQSQKVESATETKKNEMPMQTVKDTMVNDEKEMENSQEMIQDTLGPLD